MASASNRASRSARSAGSSAAGSAFRLAPPARPRGVTARAGEPPRRTATGRVPWRFSLIYVLLGLAVILFVAQLFQPNRQTVTVNLFESQLRQDDISSVKLGTSSLTWISKGDNQTFTISLPPSFQTND